MWKTKVLRIGVIVALCVVAANFVTIASAAAQTPSSSSKSTNYSVNEIQFGSGASLNSCSGSYCSKQSLGDTVVGESGSNGYSARGGFNTSTEPYLEVYALGGVQNLGVLNTSQTAVASNLIKIRNYLSNGYVLQIMGSSPSQGVHALNTMNASCPCTSQPGAEQFGINLAANTSPAVGAAPVQVPSGSFSYGQVMNDYSTPNLFKYINGDIVAQSTRSSGETDYTLSMIINTSNVTPGGRYNGALSAVAVPMY